MKQTIDVMSRQTKYKLIPGIPYSSPEGREMPLTLNILMPDNRPPAGAPPMPERMLPEDDALPDETEPIPASSSEQFPAVIYLAGGGFRFTDPFSWIPMLTWFYQRGYVAVTVDYRCSGEAKYPAALQDVKTAIRFLRAHAGEYEIDPARISVMGDSAGGYLAVMAAATGDHPAFETKEYAGHSSRVQCICDWFAPIDFLTLNASCENGREDHEAPTSPESTFLGAPLREIPELCAEASPLRYIDSSMPPLIVFHGTADTAVGPKQSELLYEAVTARGIPAELYLIRGAGHVGIEFSQPEVLLRISEFFDRHLQQG